MASREEICTSVAILCAAWRGEADFATLESYAIAVADMPAGVLRQAVVEAVREGGQWMPSPGELRSICRAIRGRAVQIAVQAWNDWEFFGRCDRRAKDALRAITAEPGTEEYYRAGRAQFIESLSQQVIGDTCRDQGRIGNG